MPDSSPLRLVQVTDTHLFAQPDQKLLGLTTADSLTAVVEQINQLSPRPDLALLTGDLSQDGSLGSYQHLLELLRSLELPLHWLPGNHDDLAAMRAVLTAPLCFDSQSFAVGGWQFLLLNSQVAGKVYGELSSQSLDRLEQELQAADCPTLIALHHPPFAIASNWLDKSGLRNPEALFAVLDRHPQVKLVVCGHIHQEFSYQRHGVTYLSCPSTGVQFQPKSSAFALDQNFPGFRQFTLYPDGQFATQVGRVVFSRELDFVAQGY
jgi:3',5'-cyclic-AMP phosphodiesterase